MANTKLTKRCVIQAKVEATAGTKETSFAAGDTLFAFDPSYTADIEVATRQHSGTLGLIQSITHGRKGKVSLKVEVAGKGGAGVPSWAVLLQAAGFGLATATYTPTSLATAHKTLTYSHYIDGLSKTLFGAVASKVAFEWEAGKHGIASVDLEGIYSAVTDTALPTLPSIPPLPPRLAGSTLTLGGASLPSVGKVGISIENEVSFREDATKTEGYSMAQIVGRKIVIALDPETLAVATRDDFGIFLANTEQAFNLVLNGGTNNTITIAAAKAQLVDVKEASRGGKVVHEMTLQANASATGDDELSIVFS